MSTQVMSENIYLSHELLWKANISIAAAFLYSFMDEALSTTKQVNDAQIKRYLKLSDKEYEQAKDELKKSHLLTEVISQEGKTYHLSPEYRYNK